MIRLSLVFCNVVRMFGTLHGFGLHLLSLRALLF